MRYSALHNRVSRSLVFVPVMVICLSSPTVTFARTWTDNQGRTVEAEFFRIRGSIVSIRRSDGKLFDVPLTRLSGQDREYARQEGARKLSLQTGVFVNLGDVFAEVPILRDANYRGAAVVKAEEKKVGLKVLAATAKNDNLANVPALANQLNRQLNPLIGPLSLHIGVFTLKRVAVTPKIKAPGRFQPGQLTRLADVVQRFGASSETSDWHGTVIGKMVGVTHPVSWWGSVGLSTDDQGVITHVLVREVQVTK